MRNNPYATPGVRNPQSRKSVVEDDDIPNTDEFPGQWASEILVKAGYIRHQ